MDQDLFCCLESKSVYGRGDVNSEFGLETKTEPSFVHINIYQHLEIHIEGYTYITSTIFKGWKYNLG